MYIATMELRLQKVLPEFIEKEKIARSQIWQADVAFKRGENVQIVAPSGSGKTTLMHFLYNLRQDYSGDIMFNEKKHKLFNPDDTASYRSAHASIIFQDLRLFPDHTALQNIEIKKSLNPFATKYTVQQMAAKLGVENKLNQLAKKCSQGERQRIAIIRALQQPFDFLLADEPFSHLDDENANLAMELIQEEASLRGAAIILADLHPVSSFKAQKTIYL